MRFVFLTLGYHPDLTGGAYRYVAEAAERLAGRGHGVEVICPNPADRLAGRESRHGVGLFRYPGGRSFAARNWRQENARARALLRERLAEPGGPALVVQAQAYFTPALAGHWPQAVFLFTGPWSAEYRWARQAAPRSLPRRWLDGAIALAMRWTERKALRRTRRILTISHYYAGQLPRWHGRRLAPISVISGGVNTEQFRPVADRSQLRRRWGLGEAAFLFLAVRRLEARMGLLTLLEGFAAVAPAFPQARLWLTGSGPLRPELEKRIAAAGLLERVRLLGLVPEADLPGLYNAADCTLMPSLDLEGFGLATAESLACGTPVLGSRAGATPELLAPLSESLLFAPGSAGALAEKLRAVLSGAFPLPERAACASYARQRFDWEGPVRGFEAAYGEVFGAEAAR
jgi:glycosyltransferase involved in cell wall biosynthesis